MTADANILINAARLSAQRYQYAYQEPQPIEQLVLGICNYKQAYTQYGGTQLWKKYHGANVYKYTGQRPFGVSFLYAGWDKHYGFQLYQSDPSGNYGGWKAQAVGANNQVFWQELNNSHWASDVDDVTCFQAARGILKSDYEEEMSITDALKLAVKVIVFVRSVFGFTHWLQVLSKTMDTTTPSAEKMEFYVLSR